MDSLDMNSSPSCGFIAHLVKVMYDIAEVTGSSPVGA